MLLTIKSRFLSSGGLPELEKEINYAINCITERRIYQSNNTDQNPVALKPNRKSVIVEGWLNEYSDASLESSSQSSFKAAKLHGLSRHSSSSSDASQISSTGTVPKDKVP